MQIGQSSLAKNGIKVQLFGNFFSRTELSGSSGTNPPWFEIDIFLPHVTAAANIRQPRLRSVPVGK
jgi:hypothetical protein